MELHPINRSSPVGFQATLTLAMELENKLKSEAGDGYGHGQQQTRICGTGSHHAITNGRCNDEEKEVEDNDTGENEKRRDFRLNKFEDSPMLNKINPDDLKKEALSNSDPMESELMEDDDDDSMGRSSPGSYADLSPSIANSKEGPEDMDDDFDSSVIKFSSSLARNGIQQSDGASQPFGVNGGVRPGSSESDYFEGGNENSHMYNHMDSENGNENGGSEKFYPCHLCSFIATSKSHFNSHLNSHYNHKCNHCDYTSRTEGRLKRHMKDFHSDLPPEAYSSTRILKVDRDGVHGDSNGNSQGKTKTYRCKQCNFTATVKAIFWEHTKSHIKAEKLLTCPKCPFVTEYKHHLEYHLRNHFGSKPFKCPKCNYSCVNKSMLNSHMKSHSNVYQYRCSDCTYATKYCHSLKLHLRKYTHKPAIVLNPDGTPNPIPVIDVYGTRRGPRQKKSHHSAEQKRYCNGNGNTNGGGFSPIPIPGSGALSPATVIPFFYPGASGPIPNGFQPVMDGLLRPGNMEKSPNGASQPPHPPPSQSNNSNHGSNGTNGKNSCEMDTCENEKIQHLNKNIAIKCNLCPFVTDHRETFSKHMILHAATDNQDLCNVYGINSESLVMDPNQQQLNASAMAAMVAALGMSNSARAELHRQSLPMSSTPINYEMMGSNTNFRSSPNALGNHKSKQNGIEDEIHMNGTSQMTNPLDHLRMFSEQSSIIQSYNMSRDFPPLHYISSNMSNYSLEASPNTMEKSSSSSYSPGAHSQKASHNSKTSKEGAISRKSKSPQIAETNNLTATGLGPLDLSGTKNGPLTCRAVSNGSPPQTTSPQASPRFTSPGSVHQEPHYDDLQVNTDGLACGQQSDLSSSNKTKHRRKGKAFKLDRICMKLQKDYGYSDSPTGEAAAEDSIGDGDLRLCSSDQTMHDSEIDFKSVDIKEELDNQSESDSSQPHKELETNGNLMYNKKRLSISKASSKSPDKSTELRKTPPLTKSTTVVDLIEVEDEVNGEIRQNGDCWKEAYECQYCDMAFKDCIMYTVHMGYHGFKDPFKCNMCGHQTKDKVAFFLHIARTAHL